MRAGSNWEIEAEWLHKVVRGCKVARGGICIEGYAVGSEVPDV